MGNIIANNMYVRSSRVRALGTQTVLVYGYLFAIQSETFDIEFAALSRSCGIGIGYFVNTGNQIDISLIGVLEITIDDGRIKLGAIYLEELCPSDAPIRFANKAMKLGKLLTVTKAGQKADCFRNFAGRRS